MTTSSPQSQRRARTGRTGEPWNSATPGKRSRSQLSVGGSVGKRSGTPALEYMRYNNLFDSPYSPTKSFVDVPVRNAEELDFELHDESHSDDGFEGLENVRACCDGRHTVGRAGPPHHDHQHNHDHLHNGDHQHHHHHHQQNGAQPNQPESSESAGRPISPAWSFRSRTGSTHSRDGSNAGIFAWGRGEDGKLRFGSRRLKTPQNVDG